MIKAVLLDCDGTVWNRTTGEVYLPAKERLHQLPRNVKKAFCTNQTSVGRRESMKRQGWGDHKKLRGSRAIKNMYDKLLMDLELPEAPIYMAFRWKGKYGWGPVEEETPEWDKDWVKPGGGMLLQAAADFGLQPSECIYIGDDSDEEQPDSGAARSAGMKFYKAPDVWDDEQFWDGFKYHKVSMFDMDALRVSHDGELTGLLGAGERRKISQEEALRNLELVTGRIEAGDMPIVLPSYGGREGAMLAARAAIAASVAAHHEIISKEKPTKKGKRRKR